MTEERGFEARIARLESCFARLEERINAIAQSRKEWRDEVARRLDENNDNARKLMQERARDRAELVTTDLYASRHSELQTHVDAGMRELTSRFMEHDRDDVRKHDDDGKKIATLELWRSNVQGRMWAVGVIAAALATIAQLVIHALTK